MKTVRDPSPYIFGTYYFGYRWCGMYGSRLSFKIGTVFFEQGTNINSIRKRMTPIFVFTSSVIIRASWLQLAISFHFFFLFSQILLENALNEGNPFFLIWKRQCVWRQSGFFYTFSVCLFICLNSQQHIFMGLMGL